MLFLLFMLLENGFHYKVNAFYVFYAFRPSLERSGSLALAIPRSQARSFSRKGEKHKKHKKHWLYNESRFPEA